MLQSANICGNKISLFTWTMCFIDFFCLFSWVDRPPKSVTCGRARSTPLSSSTLSSGTLSAPQTSGCLASKSGTTTEASMYVLFLFICGNFVQQNVFPHNFWFCAEIINLAVCRSIGYHNHIRCLIYNPSLSVSRWRGGVMEAPPLWGNRPPLRSGAWRPGGLRSAGLLRTIPGAAAVSTSSSRRKE